MEFTIIDRAFDAFQQSATREEVIILCRRAFGDGCQVKSVKELAGGLYNNTYVIQIEGMLPIILRISPPKARQVNSERKLMRNEYASIPFFASIAPLLPKTIMVDFTQQLIERDYMFQTYIDGEQWSQIKSELTANEKKALWRQWGVITKKIHGVKGEIFGNPYLNSSFPSWSLTIIDWFTSLIHDLNNVQLDTNDIERVLTIAQTYRHILDQITQPHLLHGDLWIVNILVKRNESEPQIVGIIDNDRASWGDPMADWTIFILERNSDTEEAAFWETYGSPENTREAHIRKHIYRGFYFGAIRLEQFRHHHDQAVKRTYEDMHIVIEALENLCLY